MPKSFFSDDDYFIATTANDPQVPWFNQGWWGEPGGTAHCNITGSYVGLLHFPANLTVTAFDNNNAAAILQPDNDTLVLTQPLYVCTPRAAILSILDTSIHGRTSIRGNGTWGGHGGSSLSAIGGTIRRGELLPGSGPIRHALKLELFAKDYYYDKAPGFLWPALNCDGYAFACSENPNCYGGKNIFLSPGSLLAIPLNVSASIAGKMKTEPATSLLWTLTNYGGYLVDDTYYTRGTICTEHGVTDEFKSAWGYSFNALPGDDFYADLLLVFQNLWIVTNNGPYSIGGGGSPLQPLAPPICNYTV